MLDPFPPPPAWLREATLPLAQKLNLISLPLHIHEVILSCLFYHAVCNIVSPWFSRMFFGKYYNNFKQRTRVNWDIHIVSLVQSTIISGVAIWMIIYDEERTEMTQDQRVWGYTGATGMIQALAAGYFLWDIWVSIKYLSIFGVGILAHAISAITVFSLGFRPFVNYYAPVFIMYELSSPFLNFHWFFDKVNMTGSRAQLYNGYALIGTFACCRLLWGSYYSVRVFKDIFYEYSAARQFQASSIPASLDSKQEVMRFAGGGQRDLPLWLVAAYLGANVTLNSLNWYWFAKMIEAIRKRFTPAEQKHAVAIESDGSDKTSGLAEAQTTSASPASGGNRTTRRKG